MSSVTHRFENYMRNGMGGWARSRPVVIRALLFLPCLLEYLIVYAFCAAVIAVLVFLMALVAVLRLDDLRQSGLR
ncbi:hypothetical protein [Pararhizobium sp. DWP1-1-3]|uniref:hypothetical protein n=1 Tax=Pararhizobium sp. DWP1-1-3 TaxID=2804652 RepID=UPI003CF2FDE0